MAAGIGGFGALLGRANWWRGSQAVKPVIADVAGAYTPDGRASNNFRLTLTGNLTLGNPDPAPRDGAVLNFFLKQDATGNRLMTLWPSKFLFGDTGDTSLTQAGGAIDFLSAYYDATQDRYICGFRKGFG